MIKYKHALDVQSKITDLSKKLEMEHIDNRVVCIRSNGSASKRTIARCHSLPRIMKFALGTETHYVIEVISEQYDKLNEEEQLKTLIHELMHIPKSFGGGFRFHGYVNEGNVNVLYRKYKAS
ncbi:MAG: metallopeptidase [Candidatus Aenigmarchaeota archaeon]|nr:metallopeptidase [Candidatus Aenigmarchaeota archaeon]